MLPVAVIGTLTPVLHIFIRARDKSTKSVIVTRDCAVGTGVATPGEFVTGRSGVGDLSLINQLTVGCLIAKYIYTASSPVGIMT